MIGGCVQDAGVMLCATTWAHSFGYARGYAQGYARGAGVMREVMRGAWWHLKNSEILCAPTLLIMRDVMREVMRGGRGYARSYTRGFGGILTSYDILCAPVF